MNIPFPGSACGRWVALGLAVLLAGLAPSVAAARTAYVTNNSSNSVTPVDLRTGASGAAIAVGSNPRGVAFTPDGSTAWVANERSASVTPIDVASGVPGTPVVVGGNPSGLAITPDGRALYVALTAGNTVRRVDLATRTVGPVIATGAGPDGVAITPDGTSVFTANFGANTVSRVDAASGTVTATIAVAGGPNGVAITPDGATVYVSTDTGMVRPISVATNVVGAAIAVGANARGVAITPDGASAYVAANGANSVRPVTIATSTARTAIPLSGAVGLAVTPGGGTVYAASFNTNTLRPIDVATAAPGTSSVTGTAPFGVAIVPDQAPTAAFSTTVAPPGGATTFDASASSDSDGAVTSYAWDFGDGSTATTSARTASHVYARAGSYTATMTATDDEGCSTRTIYTGQTASCNGAPTARASRTVTVAATTAPAAGSGPVISALGVDRRCVRAATLVAPRTSSGKGLTFSFSLSQTATVRYEILRRVQSKRRSLCPARGGTTPGTLDPVWDADGQGSAGEQRTTVATTAVRRTRHLRRGHRRRSLARLAGARRLSPGTYVLRVTATNAQGRSQPVTVKFWVLAARRR